MEIKITEEEYNYYSTQPPLFEGGPVTGTNTENPVANTGTTSFGTFFDTIKDLAKQNTPPQPTNTSTSSFGTFFDSLKDLGKQLYQQTNNNNPNTPNINKNITPNTQNDNGNQLDNKPKDKKVYYIVGGVLLVTVIIVWVMLKKR